jgi:hypothetical protein
VIRRKQLRQPDGFLYHV